MPLSTFSPLTLLKIQKLSFISHSCPNCIPKRQFTPRSIRHFFHFSIRNALQKIHTDRKHRKYLCIQFGFKFFSCNVLSCAYFLHTHTSLPLKKKIKSKRQHITISYLFFCCLASSFYNSQYHMCALHIFHFFYRRNKKNEMKHSLARLLVYILQCLN